MKMVQWLGGLRGFGNAWHRVSTVVAVMLPLLSIAADSAFAQKAPNPVQLAKLGKAIFHDKTLSNPTGMGCVSCHYPPAGFTSPNSKVNRESGEMPGIVTGRFGNRKPPTISYAAFLPSGPPHFSAVLGEYVGGFFWDGRATDRVAQASQPFQNPNEMNNTPAGVVSALANSPEAPLFRAVFGAKAFLAPTDQVFQQICEALAAFEATPEVSPFSSKYDQVMHGQATFTASELNGLRLFTGSMTGRPGGAPYKSANCVSCHSIPADSSTGPDIFTNATYANIGTPKNPNNPFYTETDSTNNPLGFNPLGSAYVDFGLGDFLYPAMGLPSGGGPGGDTLAINGKFKTPTVRNVDKRHVAGFVKAYTHNGVFKNLADVVHFYNARNLTTVHGEVIDFTHPHPYARLHGRPLFAPPENPSPHTLENPDGSPGDIGNLGLTPQEETDLVNFLTTLSDS